jgi:hypothetical protein
MPVPVGYCSRGFLFAYYAHFILSFSRNEIFSFLISVEKVVLRLASSETGNSSTSVVSNALDLLGGKTPQLR